MLFFLKTKNILAPFLFIALVIFLRVSLSQSFCAQPSSFILFNRQRCCVTWPFVLAWQRVLNYYCVMYVAGCTMYIGLHRNAVKRVVKTCEHLNKAKNVERLVIHVFSVANEWHEPPIKWMSKQDAPSTQSRANHLKCDTTSFG